MRKVLASALVISLCSQWAILASSGIVDSETRVEKLDCSAGVPKFVLDFVKKKYKRWTFVEYADLTRDDQLYFGEKCPGVVKGKFDKLEAVSYALLLKPKSGERVVRLIVVSVSQESVSKVYVLWKREIVENFPVLIVLSDEEYYAFYTGEVAARARPGADAVMCEQLEATATVFVFNGVDFVPVLVSD